MTTVVAIQHKDEVEFACDSMTSFGSRKSVTADKVWRVGDLTFGGAGDVRVSNVIKHADLPKPPSTRKRIELEKWLVNTLIPALQEVLENQKTLTVDNGETYNRGAFLVAVNGLAFEISGDFAVTHERDGIYAVGSGSPYAFGALAQGATAAEAVKIAAKYDKGTGGRVTVTRSGGAK